MPEFVKYFSLGQERLGQSIGEAVLEDAHQVSKETCNKCQKRPAISVKRDLQ
jgi:hypothetical protein